MNWDDARAVLAVARAGQILGAAKRLGVNQATLSRHVAALEMALNVQLFHRRTGGCDLTDAGRALLPRLERIEAEFLAAEAELTGREASVSGVVRIGAPDGFAVAWLAPKISALTARHPGLRVQLVPTPRGFSLSQREADFAILVGRPETGRLICRRLTRYCLGVYAGQAYASAHGLPESVEALRAHRLVGYVEDLVPTEQFSYTRDVLSNWQSDVEIASATGQLAAVRAGAGIGVLHRFMVADDPGFVRCLPEITVEREYWLAWHASLDGTARLHAVVDFLIAAVQQDRALFIAE